MKVLQKSYLLLIAGLVLMVGAHLTFNIGFLAWVAYVPFLLYLAQTSGWKSRLVFGLVYTLTWCLIVLKIITDPIPVAMVPLFAVPISLIHLPAFLIWAHFRRRKHAVLLFPAIMAVMEWLQYTFTPLASWGIAAYTQAEYVGLIQSVSLFGMAGLGFLIYWVNSAIANVLIDPDYKIHRLWIPGVLLLMVFSFGSLRYDLARSTGNTTLRVASVGTDSDVSGVPMPSLEIRERFAQTLFERTREAAEAGARLVVWNEAAAAVLPEEEPIWKDSLVELALRNHITLVASYVVLLQDEPVLYENKYLFILPDGSIAHQYFKHEPVPGEPAIKGTGSLKTFNLNGLEVGGAICYDYDFPYIARGYGRQNAELVVLPSSDWRGIDPIHTEMAAFRAVEQGHSVLRSTRFGLSAAITPFGEMIARQSSFDAHDKVMVADLPVDRRQTLYSLIGDLFVYLNLIGLGGFGVRVLFWEGRGRPGGE